MRAATELDYVPNAQAQGLLRGNAGTIGVLAGNVGDPYFSEMVNGIHALATEQHLLVTICHTRRDVDQELGYFRMLQAHRAQAVIIAGSAIDDSRYREGMASRTRSFVAGGGRVVAIGTPELDVDQVLVDNLAGGIALGRHLVELGHRQVGMLAGPENVVSTRERLDGLREAVEDSGGTVRVHHGAPTRDDAYAATAPLLAEYPQITALVGSADQLAIGAIARLRELGLDVPGDISVAGFNDIDISRDLSPPLTSVRLPLWDMGRAALSIALEAQSSSGVAVRRFGTELVVRASTGPVREVNVHEV